MKKKVLFLTNIPSPYRVDFFNELGKNVELTVVFEKQKSDERDESWSKKNFINFNAIFLEGIKVTVNKALCLSVKKILKEYRDHLIVCCNYATPTGIIAIDYMIRHSIPYVIEGDGAIIKKCNIFKRFIKTRSFSNAVALLSTSRSLDEYFVHFGADASKIYRYHFSSIENSDIVDSPCNHSKKEEIRSLLGIEEDHVILTVGQFIYRKGFDVLLKAAKSFDNSYGFYFIGGTPTDEYEKLVNTLKIENVHFVGFKEKSELKQYFLSADIFAFPTREDIWGLVINEALAFGVPVISTNRCVAALEMIEDNCGYIINADSVTDLVEKISTAYERDLYEMGKSSIDIARKYTIEIMCNDHMQLFNQIWS